MKILNLCFALAFCAAAGACKTKSDLKAPAAESTAAATATPAAESIVMPGDAKVGDTSMCLVSGETFVVAADSPKADYEGKTYYFCCPGCQSKFAAEPAKYLANMPTPGAAGMHQDDAHGN